MSSMERTPMVSKTKESGRADILVRMSPRLKERITKAASEHGLTNNDWLLDVIKDGARRP